MLYHHDLTIASFTAVAVAGSSRQMLLCTIMPCTARRPAGVVRPMPVHAGAGAGQAAAGVTNSSYIPAAATQAAQETTTCLSCKRVLCLFACCVA